jgi:methionyl-tRNA synthetase
LSPDELINPVSTLSGKAPVKKKTTHWYSVGKHEQFLREWILKDHKDDWRPPSWVNVKMDRGRFTIKSSNQRPGMGDKSSPPEG